MVLPILILWVTKPISGIGLVPLFYYTVNQIELENILFSCFAKQVNLPEIPFVIEVIVQNFSLSLGTIL